jgi:ubiquinone/menaquinone biosynthesis C-methylase UbiE
MNGFLEKEARRLGLDIELHGGTVEALPFADESVDHVVSTLVFCSVDDQARALREVWRVLKPGGRFVFIEHVAAAEGTTLLRLQSVMAPAWRLVADGCRPDRRTWEAISSAGFGAVEIERFHVSAGPFGPHIAGFAVK